MIRGNDVFSELDSCADGNGNACENRGNVDRAERFIVILGYGDQAQDCLSVYCDTNLICQPLYLNGGYSYTRNIRIWCPRDAAEVARGGHGLCMTFRGR